MCARISPSPRLRGCSRKYVDCLKSGLCLHVFQLEMGSVGSALSISLCFRTVALVLFWTFTLVSSILVYTALHQPPSSVHVGCYVCCRVLLVWCGAMWVASGLHAGRKKKLVEGKWVYLVQGRVPWLERDDLIQVSPEFSPWGLGEATG